MLGRCFEHNCVFRHTVQQVVWSINWVQSVNPSGQLPSWDTSVCVQEGVTWWCWIFQKWKTLTHPKAWRLPRIARSSVSGVGDAKPNEIRVARTKSLNCILEAVCCRMRLEWTMLWRIEGILCLFYIVVGESRYRPIDRWKKQCSVQLSSNEECHLSNLRRDINIRACIFMDGLNRISYLFIIACTENLVSRLRNVILERG